MKTALLLLLSCSFFFGSHQAIAQDPFTLLKQAASQRTLQREMVANVALSENDGRRRVERKTALAFRPFEMVDKGGRKIDPNETVTVNGRSIRAQEFFDKLNEIEKEQNAKGYSIRDNRPLIVDIVTPASSLDGNAERMPKSISRLKTAGELETVTAATKRVGNVELKYSGEYSAAEKKKLSETTFSTDASGTLSASYTPPPATKTTSANKLSNMTGVWGGNKNLPATTATGTSAGTSSPVKLINETSTKDWSFGADSTLRAGFKADLTRYAKIYPFNPQSPGKSLSEFRVNCNARVYGTIFNHTLNFFSAGMEFYAPSDSTKQMTAKGTISAVGITILSMNESATQSKTYSKFSGIHYDKSFGITIPICCGVSFTGTIGVKGDVGLNYNGGLYRTVAKLEATPVIDLKGYAEGGLQAGIVKFGAGAEITFIKAQAPLYGLVGIWNQDARQIVVGYSYYMGYDLSMLSGRLYGFADICCPFIGCARVGEVNFFKWGGYTQSGTIADGTTSYVINL